jgi:hypothetical protein
VYHSSWFCTETADLKKKLFFSPYLQLFLEGKVVSLGSGLA